MCDVPAIWILQYGSGELFSASVTCPAIPPTDIAVAADVSAYISRVMAKAMTTIMIRLVIG